MDLSLPKFDQKTRIRLILWVVFIGLCATLGWCFWFYYNTNLEVNKTGAGQIVPPPRVNEAQLNSVLDTQAERAAEFNKSPIIKLDPFE